MSDENKQHEHHEGEVTIQEAQTVKVDAAQPNSNLPLAVFLGLALIAAAIYFGPSKGLGGITAPGTSGNNPSATAGDTTPKEPVNVSAGDLPTLGDANAPVLLVEWADFQCPFCQRFNEQVITPLEKDYIATGKVRYSFRDFAFLGQESVDAAVAARCANEQGNFWQYHDKLYASQNGENQGGFSKDNLKKFAKDLGLDTATFNACLDSNKYVDAVNADTNAGKTAGVSGTPTSFVNGKIVSGAQPYTSVKKIIDDELSK